MEDLTCRCHLGCSQCSFASFDMFACQIKQLPHSCKRLQEKSWRPYEITWSSVEQRAQCSLEKCVTAYGLHFQMGGISSALHPVPEPEMSLILHLGCFVKTCLDQRCLCCQAGCLGFTTITVTSTKKTLIRIRNSVLSVSSISLVFQYKLTWVASHSENLCLEVISVDDV